MPLETDMLEFYPLRIFRGLIVHGKTTLRICEILSDLPIKTTNLLVVVIPAKEQVYPYFIKDKHIDLEQPNRFLGEFFKEKTSFISICSNRFGNTQEKGHQNFSTRKRTSI